MKKLAPLINRFITKLSSKKQTLQKLSTMEEQ